MHGTSAASVNKRRQFRGGGYDDLARKTAKSQHQPCFGHRCSIEAADCAHNDPSVSSENFDLDARDALLEICDQTHTLIGHDNVQVIRCSARQRRR
jgi:hypothetical protein